MKPESRTDRIIATSVELAAARKRVTRLEAVLDDLLGGGRPEHPPLEPREGTMAEAVLAFIAEHDRPVNGREILKALPAYMQSSINMTCNRMVQRGALRRVAPNTYEVAR